MSYTYENYLKAIVPLVLAAGTFFVGWVDNGVPNRAELADVVELFFVALLVFLVPNTKKERKPKKPRQPADSQAQPQEQGVADTMRMRRKEL